MSLLEFLDVLVPGALVLGSRPRPLHGRPLLVLVAGCWARCLRVLRWGGLVREVEDILF